MPRNPRFSLLLTINTTSVNTPSKSPLSAAARTLVKLFVVSLRVPRWSAPRAKPVRAMLWKRSDTSERWWAIFEKLRAWPTRSFTPLPRSCLRLIICWRRPRGWRDCPSFRTFCPCLISKPQLMGCLASPLVVWLPLPMLLLWCNSAATVSSLDPVSVRHLVSPSLHPPFLPH